MVKWINLLAGRLLKSPNSPHREGVELIEVVLVATAEVLESRVVSIVLGGTPIEATSKTANDGFLYVQ